MNLQQSGGTGQCSSMFIIIVMLCALRHAVSCDAFACSLLYVFLCFGGGGFGDALKGQWDAFKHDFKALQKLHTLPLILYQGYYS